MKSGVFVLADRTADLRRAMQALATHEVVVGIPAAKGERKEGEDGEGPVTNAQLGYIHEKGSPKRNIPARPFLIPGIRKVQPGVVDQLRAAGRQALEGKLAGVLACLNRVGILAQNSARAHFVDNDWPALADATLDKRPPADRGEDGKITRRRKSRRERGALNPLIDTSQMRKSVTYLVRRRTR